MRRPTENLTIRSFDDVHVRRRRQKKSMTACSSSSSSHSPFHFLPPSSAGNAFRVINILIRLHFLLWRGNSAFLLDCYIISSLNSKLNPGPHIHVSRSLRQRERQRSSFLTLVNDYRGGGKRVARVNEWLFFGRGAKPR